MEHHIEPQVVLLAAEKIREVGEAREGRHYYQQLALEISYDGYTIVISDPKVTLTLFFHNKVKVDYRQSQDLDDFYRRLIQLAKDED
ncbi:DUF3081 family protein [Alkalimarinus sediminis]|uniref:DUF3081 domain-containing protein n=1 Tax=Alkalimarinus sediminis TaxID=1632866 RepID=A0A9E8HML5_9ALTE|nr:DUF3081 family protein [Alkalimarinus sediminis]UZW75676.1 DUF3081 domain-containing protein [Alkalimarinus sediminis]